jgi:DNA polymerase-3 subunit gamma/tau
VREIIEAVRYAAVSARYKIYIIDEVHMLSKNAFNALLKTLEEPPAHVKFLFATTEVNKVPITVLSRCQRFDLKRIPAELLATHFAEICEKEGVSADAEALRLVAQAAEGSVRDGLSILDQAIAHADLAADDSGSEARVEAAQVRNMLGLSDRAAVRRLFGLLLEGNAPAVLDEARNQYQLGVEPAATLAGLLREVHLVTLAKIGSPPDAALPQEAREQIDEWAGRLSFPLLHRLWQLLLKGHEEVRQASLPLECCDMALLRVMHGASMPDPGELARLLQEGGVPAQPPAGSSSPASAGNEPAMAAAFPADFRSLVEALDRGGHPNVAATLHDVVRLVRYAPPRIEFQLAGPVHQGFGADLNDALFRLTGTRWEIAETPGEARPSLYEQEQVERAAQDNEILESPLVKAALAAFPEAEVHVDGRTIHSPHEAEIRSLRA